MPGAIKAISALRQERVRLYETKFMVHIHVVTTEDVEFLDTAHSDHARVQDYNDGTHCECTTNHGSTHAHLVRNAAHVRFFR